MNDGQKLFPSKLGEVSIAEELLLKLLLFFMCWISLNARSISVDGMIFSTHHPMKTVLHLLGYFKNHLLGYFKNHWSVYELNLSYHQASPRYSPEIPPRYHHIFDVTLLKVPKKSTTRRGIGML